MQVYAHANASHLEQLLEAAPNWKRKIVVTDSVFSMDGAQHVWVSVHPLRVVRASRNVIATVCRYMLDMEGANGRLASLVSLTRKAADQAADLDMHHFSTCTGQPHSQLLTRLLIMN